MKLTKESLKRIIKEELDAVLNEEELDEGLFDFFKGKKKEEPQEEEPVEQLRPVAQLIKDAHTDPSIATAPWANLFLKTVKGSLRDHNGKLFIDPDSADHEDYIFVEKFIRSLKEWAQKKHKSKTDFSNKMEPWEYSDTMKWGYIYKPRSMKDRDPKNIWNKAKENYASYMEKRKNY
jgi:hypothetical protein